MALAPYLLYTLPGNWLPVPPAYDVMEQSQVRIDYGLIPNPRSGCRLIRFSRKGEKWPKFGGTHNFLDESFIPENVDAKDMTPILRAFIGSDYVNAIHMLNCYNMENIDPNDENHMKNFYVACALNCIKPAKLFIEKGLNVNGFPFELPVNYLFQGARPLHMAVHQQSEELVHLLLEHNARTTTRDWKGRTPLHIAFYASLYLATKWPDHYLANQRITEQMFTEFRKSPIDVVDYHGMSVLHVACASRRASPVVATLLNMGADALTPVRSTKSPVYSATPLHIAATFSQYEVIPLLLDRGARADKMDAYGRTPIARALCRKPIHLETFLRLLTADVCPNILDQYCRTPLHLAVEYRNLETIRPLLNMHADVHRRDWHNNTPLHAAFARGFDTAVDDMLDKARYKLKNSINKLGISHFHIACWAGNEVAVRHFINAEVDVNGDGNVTAPTYTGFKPLDFAIMRYRTRIIEILLENGADMNLTVAKRTKVPLFYMFKASSPCLLKFTENVSSKKIDDIIHKQVGEICYNKPKVLDIFVGCLKDAVDFKKSMISDLMFLCFDNLVCIYARKECTADTVNILCKGLRHGQTVLLQFCDMTHDILANLIHQGMDLNAVNAKGNTLLHRLVMHPDAVRVFLKAVEEMAEMCIEYGADINFKNAEGQTPLHLAAIVGNYRLVSLLMRRGANIHTTDNQLKTPLHIVCGSPIRTLESDIVLIMTALLAAGADVNARDIDGKTPLFYALDRPYPKLVLRFLLSFVGCHVNARDKDNRTPLFHAIKFDYHDVMEFLYNGADVNAIDNYGRCVVEHFDKWIAVNEDSVTHRNVYLCLVLYTVKLTEFGFTTIRVHSERCKIMHTQFFSLPGAVLGPNLEAQSLPDYSRYWKARVANLRDTMLTEYDSIYNILFKNEYEMMWFSRNPRFIQFLETPTVDSKWFMFHRQFRKGVMRRALHELAKESFFLATSYYAWPEPALKNIFGNLRDNDVKNIILAEKQTRQMCPKNLEYFRERSRDIILEIMRDWIAILLPKEDEKAKKSHARIKKNPGKYVTTKNQDQYSSVINDNVMATNIHPRYIETVETLLDKIPVLRHLKDSLSTDELSAKLFPLDGNKSIQAYSIQICMYSFLNFVTKLYED